MTNKRFAFSLISVTPVVLAAAGCASDPVDDIDDDAVYAANQANGFIHTATAPGSSGESRFCCNNLPGYGSVYYYQQCAGTTSVSYGSHCCFNTCNAWVTTNTAYMQGASCPGTSGTCN